MSSLDRPMIYRDEMAKSKFPPQHKLSSRLRRLWKRLDRLQIIDREYIEGETAEEIGHIGDTDFPNKAMRPLAGLPRIRTHRHTHSVR